MDNYERHALADREVRAGLIDGALMTRAIGEAKGIRAHALQIYLERRAKQIQEKAVETSPVDPGIYFRELQAQLKSAEKRLARRYRLEGWTWVFICFGSVATSTVFLYFASAAPADGSALGVRDALLSIAFMILGIASFIRTKRIENRELMLPR